MMHCGGVEARLSASSPPPGSAVAARPGDWCPSAVIQERGREVGGRRSGPLESFHSSVGIHSRLRPRGKRTACTMSVGMRPRNVDIRKNVDHSNACIPAGWK